MMGQTVFVLTLLTCLTHAQQEFEVNTLSGPVRGLRLTSDHTFDIVTNIPFAKPPTGSLRFKPPQPVDPWTTPPDPARLSPACLQINPNHLIKKDANHPMYFAGTFSEDCLYLNIWRPSNANVNSKLPVMLNIHGGSFNTGMKDVPLYNGEYYTTKHDVILVNINYRVGLLGFGYLGQDTLPGNLGLLDQLEAMKWIHNNIENFGGDPKKITIFGENAGSWSVGLHLISPLSTAYFDKAIMQSGSPLNKLLSSVVYPHEISRQHVKNVTQAIACPTHTDLDVYNCLMNASTDTLLEGIGRVGYKGIDFYPVVDGYFLPEPPNDLIKKGFHKKTNLLIGVTKHEYALPINSMMNPLLLTRYQAGLLSFDSFDALFGTLPLTNKWPDKQKVNDLKAFYGSSVSNLKEKVVEVLKDIGSDLVFACPVHLYASHASEDNDVYFYVFNYKISTNSLHRWAKLSHRYDLEITFGLPLNLSTVYTDGDREVSRSIMTYWTNFAKTGNPNTPVPLTTKWPTFNYTGQFYMAVNPDGSVVTRQGPRRHECAFVNEILPNVQDESTTPKPCEWPHGPTNKGSNVRLDITGVLAAAAIVMMVQ